MLMSYINEFLTVALVHILAVMSPGPDFAVVTKNSLVYSRKSGLFSAIGIALGILVHVTYSIIGVALIISKTPILLAVIKYAGASYIAYLGYMSLAASRPAAEGAARTKNRDITPGSALKMGFITNVTNPNATLFFLSIFTTLISRETPAFFKTLYGIEMSLATFAWFALVALIFSHSFLKARFTGIQYYVEKLMGIVFIFLALKIFFNW
jgi:RhtB (resistance to homoserine/threonine) family protein